ALSRAADGRQRRLALAIAGVAAAVLLAQSASLLLSPDDPRPFTRPLAQSGPARSLSKDEVQTAADAIRRCPAGTAYSGPPFLAFVAERAIAGSQPDQFIIHESPALAEFREAADRARPLCAVAAGGQGPARP
ncbi:MAG: hypothetical protein ACRDLS_07535, partial [Solirubrobacteraceae bacterium]